MSKAEPAPEVQAPDAERVISDVETLKAISDPLRLRILELMVTRPNSAWSVKELAAGLDVWPASGHLLNLEEPEVFNDRVACFLKAVEAGAWSACQPAATRKSSH